MSDTPRVDAAEIRHGKGGYSYLTVSVEFARQLERELCRLTADNERLRGLLEKIVAADDDPNDKLTYIRSRLLAEIKAALRREET